MTPRSVSLCSEISLLIGKIEGIQSTPPKIYLLRRNRIKTIQASLAIEGNQLTIDQVTALFENKRVLGPKKDILEVQNAIQAYAQIKQYNPNSVKSLLQAHEVLMKDLVTEAGKFRSTQVGIMKGEQVVHIAPKPHLVPKLMEDLFSFLKQDKETPALIKSCVFHYEFEFIHPFSDGNGRMGRLWQSVILLKQHPLFEFIPIEVMIKKRQKEYYHSLGKSDQEGNSTVFVEFMLETILKSVEEFLTEYKPETETVESRLESARKEFAQNLFTRKAYLQLHKKISTATASRDLLSGVEQDILKKVGAKALTQYRFKKPA